MIDDDTQEFPKDFFISYTSADRIWAEWITWQLKENGYKANLPDLGLRSEKNFALEIDTVFREAKRIIAIISPDYLRALYAQLEWAIIFRQEATRKQGLVLPVIVRECKRGLKSLGMGAVNYLDLAGQNETVAQKMLLASVHSESGQTRILEDFSYHLEDQTLRATLKQQLSVLRQQSRRYDWQDNEQVTGELVSPLLEYIPYERNPFFTDREAILKRLQEVFAVKNAIAQPQALSGLGGIGKTQIALEYAYRHKDEYQYIFWTQAATKESLNSDFLSFAGQLNLPVPQSSDPSMTVATVKRWFQDHTDWLLILDNADDLEMVSNFIPSESKGHILLTTRAQAVGTIAQCIAVDTMKPEEGAYFLLRRINKIAPDAPFTAAGSNDRHIAEEISREMDGFPLALDQAGAYIEKTLSSLSTYHTIYSKQRTKLLEERGKSTSDHPDSIVTTWSLSFDSIEKAHPAAADLLRLCAFLAPDDIPEEIFLKGADYLGPELKAVAVDPFERDTVIEEVLKFSFLSRNPERKALSIHRLVQAVLQEKMTSETRRTWAKRAVQAVNAVFPEVKFATWSQCERYFPHALACISFIQDPIYHIQFEGVGRLLLQVGIYLVERAQYHDAEPLYRQALAMYQMLEGPNHPDVAITLNALAWLYRTLDRYEQAEQLFKQALAILEKTLGLNHVSTAQTLSNLAWLYYNQGKYAHSVTLHQQALVIRQRILGLNHPDVATSLNSLAWLYFVLGKYGEAEKLYQESLAIRRYALSADHPYLATTFDNMARLYLVEGKYAAAEEYYNRSLSIRQLALAPEHPDIAHSLDGLGQLHYALGKYSQAEAFYLRAWDIRKKVYGTNHRHIARTLTHLARLYRLQGRYTEAEPLYLQALAMRKQMLGIDHPDVAQSLTYLARLHRSLGRYGQAEQLYEEALKIRERVLGPNHPLVAQVFSNLARLYRTLGRYTEAEPLYIRVLGLRKEALGDDHPDVAQTLNNLAKLYRIQGKYTQAEQYGQQARNIWEKSLGSNHPYLALILNNLAEIYAEQDQDALAEELYREAWSIELDCLGSDHPYQALILNNLATLYGKRGEYDRAESLLMRAIELRQRALGKDHPYVAYSLNALAIVYHAQGYYSQSEDLLKQAIHIREQMLGVNHPDLATSLDSLAELYRSQEKYIEAEPLYLRALHIRESVLGPYHLDVATSLYHIAELYSTLHKYDQAELLYQRTLDIYEHAHAFSHSDMLRTMKRYADLLWKMKQHVKAREIVRRVLALQNKDIREFPSIHEQKSDIEGS